MAKVAAATGAIYESHIRAESSRGVGVHRAVDEVIEIARAAKIAAHIAHIKVLGKGVWGESSNIVDKIAAARAEGLAITADQYPWVASSTQLKSAVVSKEYQLGGIGALRERLSDSGKRIALLEDIAVNTDRRGGPNSLLNSQRTGKRTSHSIRPTRRKGNSRMDLINVTGKLLHSTRQDKAECKFVRNVHKCPQR